jgi:protocatechuate 4,5-dioxygenase alpha chain
MVTAPDDFDDIPGTVVFTGRQTRKGYHLNQFCMSLMKADNRERFKADPGAYLDEWPLTQAQRRAVLDRDYNAAIVEGGNIYFLSKIIFTDGQSMQHAAGVMTGMSTEDYRAMMAAGGRAPQGWRSVKEGY